MASMPEMPTAAVQISAAARPREGAAVLLLAEHLHSCVAARTDDPESQRPARIDKRVSRLNIMWSCCPRNAVP